MCCSGPTTVLIEGMTEEKTNWTIHDFRFVQKDDAVYAFCLGAQGGASVTLHSFRDQEIHDVILLGYGKVPFRKELGVLVVQLPDNLPVSSVNTLKIL